MFEEIKESVSVRAVAERYGIGINRSGFARCPFHEEKTASLKIYDTSFYCFGCGAGGDVIKFVSLLEGISNSQAAMRINEEFGLCLSTKRSPAAKSEYQRRKYQEEKEKQRFRKEYLSKCDKFRALNEELITATGFHRSEIMAELEYLDYYFENTDWRW